ncbi:MAG: hypothetical protein ACOCX1_01985, partial [Fimbriimonadaceae bacterium]
MLHAASQRAVEAAARLDLYVAVCYEDRTLKARVEDGDISPELVAAELAKQIAWLDGNWFERDNYVRLNDRPVLLVFGPTYVMEAEPWLDALSKAHSKPLLFTLHYERSFEDGVYDWPLPGSETTEKALAKQREFAAGPGDEGDRIPVVFPGFRDIYEQAGLHESYGTIDFRDGYTFRETLQTALNADAPFIQVATWNDWGEGTMIEPSQEGRFLYLEILQRARRSSDPAFAHEATAFETAFE